MNQRSLWDRLVCSLTAGFQVCWLYCQTDMLRHVRRHCKCQTRWGPCSQGTLYSNGDTGLATAHFCWRNHQKSLVTLIVLAKTWTTVVKPLHASWFWLATTSSLLIPIFLLSVCVPFFFSHHACFSLTLTTGLATNFEASILSAHFPLHLITARAHKQTINSDGSRCHFNTQQTWCCVCQWEGFILQQASRQPALPTTCSCKPFKP